MRDKLLVFFLLFFGVVVSAECYDFSADVNNNLVQDSNGNIVLCDFEDLNVLIVDNNSLSLENFDLKLSLEQANKDLNSALESKQSLINGVNELNTELNFYKPEYEKKNTALSACETEKAVSDEARRQTEEENTKLTTAVYSKLDAVAGDTKGTKDAANGLVVFMNEYVTNDKTRLTESLQTCQENYDSLNAELLSIGFLVLLGILYLASKIVKKYWKGKPKPQPIIKRELPVKEPENSPEQTTKSEVQHG